MLTLALSVLIMIALSAICSGAEAALFSLSQSKVNLLEDVAPKKAKLLTYVLTNKDRFISTIVLLNNIVNIMGSMFIAQMATGIFGSAWMGVFSFILTISIIMFAEILPKAIATRKSLEVSRTVAPILNIARIILKPVIVIIDAVSSFFIKLLLGELKEEAIAESEIKYLVKEGAKNKHSEIRKNENELIQNVFALHDTAAKTIMTPRKVMTYLYGEETLKEKELDIEEFQHSRIVIVGEDLDHVKGIALKTDLLIELKNGDKSVQIQDLECIDKKPLIFSENTSAESMMIRFQRLKKHIAIVKDSYGGVSGVVTFEDVLEVLVGEIVDETDEVIDMQEHAKDSYKSERREAS